MTISSISDFIKIFILFFNAFVLWEFLGLFLDLLPKRYARKKFKEKYVQDNPYYVEGIYDPQSDKYEKWFITNRSATVLYPNDTLCNKEENAQLICTILNCDAAHKRFDIKAYLKGLDIEKLKALEGQEEKDYVCKSKR